MSTNHLKYQVLKENGKEKNEKWIFYLFYLGKVKTMKHSGPNFNNRRIFKIFNFCLFYLESFQDLHGQCSNVYVCYCSMT